MTLPPGGITGQYVHAWPDARPVISDIPDQTVAKWQRFGQINLNDFMEDYQGGTESKHWYSSGRVRDQS